jgi:hypothetical protein
VTACHSLYAPCGIQPAHIRVIIVAAAELGLLCSVAVIVVVATHDNCSNEGISSLTGHSISGRVPATNDRAGGSAGGAHCSMR